MASALFARCRNRDAQNRLRVAPSNGVVEETITPIQAPDLCQVAVLPKAEWLRIQDNLNHVNKHNNVLQEISKEREALHLRSKEVVKLWSNTITSGLLLTEVLKEREAQLQLKQKTQNACRNLDRDIIAALERKDEEAMQQEEESAKQRRLKNKATAEDLKQQMKEHEHNENLEKLRIQKEAEELLQLQELYNRERHRFEQMQKEQKRRNMNAYKEHMATRDLLRALDAKKEELEEERRKLIVAGREKMLQLRREKETEMLRDVQRRNEALLESVAELERQRQQEEATNEETMFANAVAEREARLAQEQKERDEKKMAMLSAIALHRDTKRQEEEENEREEKHKDLDILHGSKKADRFFFEDELLKVQKIKEDRKTLQDAHIRQMAERHAKMQLEMNQEMDFNTTNEDRIADEEKWFRIYAKGVIDRAEETERNTYPLNKAARKGSGGGLGPVIGGVRPSYLVEP
ncbi:coiled-coil domain-containing protein 173-like isoform X1 [Scleropages formosus]|uniref:coiled-coil domain-containing protein 173-like isoform X1 n=1 Tax=Scleropages formosus TaxID=113540 RepID=UPI000878456C|nr:coiled-coil domain-containing protein 173-like isoform X1 [Scleropages formosus]